MVKNKWLGGDHVFLYFFVQSVPYFSELDKRIIGQENTRKYKYIQKKKNTKNVIKLADSRLRLLSFRQLYVDRYMLSFRQVYVVGYTNNRSSPI